MKLILFLLALIMVGCSPEYIATCTNSTTVIINNTVREVQGQCPICSPIIQYVDTVNHSQTEQRLTHQYLNCVYDLQNTRSELNDCLSLNATSGFSNMTHDYYTCQINLNATIAQMALINKTLGLP